MRKLLLPLVFGSALMLAGCVYAGLAPAMVEAVRETGGQGRYAGEYLAPAAEEACRARAARHGRVEITRVEPHNRNTMRVYGTIEDSLWRAEPRLLLPFPQRRKHPLLSGHLAATWA
jgi:hypothetical protein